MNDKFILVSYTIQDGNHYYTEHYAETLDIDQDIQDEKDRRRKELKDVLEFSNRALRRFYIVEITAQEYNILNQYL